MESSVVGDISGREQEIVKHKHESSKFFNFFFIFFFCFQDFKFSRFVYMKAAITDICVFSISITAKKKVYKLVCQRAIDLKLKT
ncbi:hypothetical protein Hanom_Chr05g00438121 [Helianthus anomalus]